jgi:Tol biopolymer transport system component
MTRRRTLYLPALIVAAVLMACAEAVLAISEKAEAIFSGQNGRIAYQDWFSLVIYTINPNGSGKTRVTKPCVYPSLADYSPTGKKITCTSCEGTLGKDLGISTIDVGGGGKFRVTHVTHNNTEDQEPSYSPDGKKIVFSSTVRNFLDHDSEIYMMNVHGKNRVRLTHNNMEDYYPDYSPNGRRIAFAGSGETATHIYTIRAHGGDKSKVTKGYYASYSPDGKKIAYSRGTDRNSVIYTINVGGGGESKVTEGGYPSWGSRP